MIQGSCCCGTIKFVLHSKPKFLGICHCSRCRKLGASEFFMVEKASFEWVSGRDEVVEYAPEPPFIFKRCFCKKCGSSLGEVLSDESEFPVVANVLDSDPNLKVLFHEHAATRPSWQLIHSGAKVFEADPH
ncbi:GFA family protein [Vibrio penaeicida]|uniref:GFA family protein n=1 Tax=Vibrio penaeicida TaxID=104609 RepID=UPI000F835F4B|nr:GFA family protein [Vibrio penaeicida]RTZ20013.1 GFA family protein [Vibrio penaeicida]